MRLTALIVMAVAGAMRLTALIVMAVAASVGDLVKPQPAGDSWGAALSAR